MDPLQDGEEAEELVTDHLLHLVWVCGIPVHRRYAEELLRRGGARGNDVPTSTQRVLRAVLERSRQSSGLLKEFLEVRQLSVVVALRLRCRPAGLTGNAMMALKECMPGREESVDVLALRPVCRKRSHDGGVLSPAESPLSLLPTALQIVEDLLSIEVTRSSIGEVNKESDSFQTEKEKERTVGSTSLAETRLASSTSIVDEGRSDMTSRSLEENSQTSLVEVECEAPVVVLSDEDEGE